MSNPNIFALAAALTLSAFAGTAIGTTAATLALDASAAPAHGARLVGYGCEGATGPIYAASESDFPRCAAIEPIDSRVIYSAVIEYSNGESDIIERGSMLDCIEALTNRPHRDDWREIRYCEAR